MLRNSCHVPYHYIPQSRAKRFETYRLIERLFQGRKALNEEALPCRVFMPTPERHRGFASRIQQAPASVSHRELARRYGIHRCTVAKWRKHAMVAERFNGRIAEILRSERFVSAADLQETLTRYLWAYNHSIPQRALGHMTPIEKLR